MFKRFLIAATAVAAFATLTACSTMPAAGSEADLLAAGEKLRAAMIDPTGPALDAVVAAELSYGHSGGKVDTKASFIADLMSGASDFVTLNLTEQTVRISQNVGIIRHRLTAQTLDGGKPGNVNILVLQVWQQQGGQWKLVARQAIRPPQP